MRELFIQVAVFAPLRGTFTYSAPGVAGDIVELKRGQAVRVPFGRSSRLGIVVQVTDSKGNYGGEIKPINELCGPEPLLKEDDLILGEWAANYYHHPIGEVFAAMLPVKTRRDGRPNKELRTKWRLSTEFDLGNLSKSAKRQLEMAEFIGSDGKYNEELSSLAFDWRRALKQLESKGFVIAEQEQLVPSAQSEALFSYREVPLNDKQREITDGLLASKGEFSPSLLHGVTGSGKTNIYIDFIASTIENGGQALLLLPEIAITQQLVDRFTDAFGDTVEVSHSGLTDRQRAHVWSKYRQGHSKILLGTRSAVWVSAQDLRCIVVDEEHDPSYKQLEGFRYSARDVAVFRASRLDIPIVLGSATPSFESYRNASLGKYQLYTLGQRASGATIPTLRIEDIRSLRLKAGLSPQLIAAINARLARKEQTILFLNRRGYAPVMLCHQCGTVWECERCDSKLVLHRELGQLVCHQCDKRLPASSEPNCCDNPEMVPLGQGTEQLAEQLAEIFPDRIIRRIDRDTVRKKSELDEILSLAKNGEIDILLGTQMLAKGHDFPNVTLVGVVDADSRLFSLDFRAEERLAQLIIQVAGRAGRARAEGEVIVQTRQPFHWIFDALANGRYDEFLHKGLSEREAAQLPPFQQAALIRAEATTKDSPYAFLRAMVGGLRKKSNGASLYGPMPSQIERRAGKYRAEVVVFTQTRPQLGNLLTAAVSLAADLPQSNRVRWHIDVDPLDP
ncbi:MAG: primosomal protein N' [Pseudomonadota bacterium]